jgi:V/A-type H+-transporting ATPase subunit C
MPVSDGNYSYVNARVKARKRNLLTGDAYPKLMKMGPGQIARLLGETAYRDEMLRLAARYEGDELLEKALNANLARSYRDVLGFCKGDLRRMVRAYLDRWNVWNFKTVLRGVHHRVPKAEVLEELVPAGSLSAADFEAMMELDGIGAIIQHTREMGYDAPPAAALARYSEDGNLGPIEDFYDKNYYVRLLESIRGRSKPVKIYRSFVQREIDVTNAKNLMKLKLDGVEGAKALEYMIPGGKDLDAPRLAELAAAAPDDALEGIRKALDDKLGGVKASDGASAVALGLDRHLLKLAERQSHIYPLSILPVLNYLMRKKEEVDFVRLIVRGKSAGIPDHKIREMILT